MYPHSLPFRQPVDPVLEQIPVTYFVRFVVNAVSFAKVYAFLLNLLNHAATVVLVVDIAVGEEA